MADRIALSLIPRAWSQVTAAEATLTAGSDPDGLLATLYDVGPGQLLTRWRAASPAPDDAWIGVEFATPVPIDVIQVIGTNRTRSGEWRIRAGSSAPSGLETIRPIDDSDSAPPPALPVWSAIDDPVDDAGCLASSVAIGPGEATTIHFGPASGPLAIGPGLQSVRIRAGGAAHGGEILVDLYQGPPPPAPPAPILITELDSYSIRPSASPTMETTRIYTYPWDGAGFAGSDVAIRLSNPGTAAVVIYAVEITADATAAADYDSGWIPAGLPLSDAYPADPEPALFATLSHVVLHPSGEQPAPVVAAHWRIDFRDDAGPGVAAGGLVMGQAYHIGAGAGIMAVEIIDTTRLEATDDQARFFVSTPGDRFKAIEVSIGLPRTQLWADIFELTEVAGVGVPVGVFILPGFVGLPSVEPYSAAELSDRSAWAVRLAADLQVEAPGVPGQDSHEAIKARFREFH